MHYKLVNSNSSPSNYRKISLAHHPLMFPSRYTLARSFWNLSKIIHVEQAKFHTGNHIPSLVELKNHEFQNWIEAPEIELSIIFDLMLLATQNSTKTFWKSAWTSKNQEKNIIWKRTRRWSSREQWHLVREIWHTWEIKKSNCPWKVDLRGD